MIDLRDWQNRTSGSAGFFFPLASSRTGLTARPPATIAAAARAAPNRFMFFLIESSCMCRNNDVTTLSDNPAAVEWWNSDRAPEKLRSLQRKNPGTTDTLRNAVEAQHVLRFDHDGLLANARDGAGPAPTQVRRHSEKHAGGRLRHADEIQCVEATAAVQH